MKPLLEERVSNEFTLVHIACKNRFYKLVLNLIENHGFNVDFHKQDAKLTLLHVIAKHTSDMDFTNGEKEDIR